MKKIFFTSFLALSLFIGNTAFAEDNIKKEDDSKPSIKIEFNNFEKFEDRIDDVKRLDGEKVEIKYDDARGLGGVLGVALFFGIFIAAICITALVFWILMLVHAISKPIKSKAVWILIILLFGILGAIVYYFAIKRDFDKKPESVSAEKVD